MKLPTCLVSLVLAGALGLADNNAVGPTNPDRSAGEGRIPEVLAYEFAERTNISEPSEAAIVYCYFGSIIDETTGDTVDLYGPCSENSPEENLDVA